MKTMRVACKDDIWDTEYTLRIYGNKKAVITVPFTKWVHIFGSLQFKKVSITNPKKVAMLKKMFENDSLVYYDADGSYYTIDDVLYY